MKSLILYYSRTGTTAKVAEALSEELAARTAVIECARYEGGWLRYLMAGYDSVKGRLPPIVLTEDSLAGYDLVLLGAPIWTSYPALPLRSFLAQKPELPPKVGLFLTYGGHSPPEKASSFVSNLLPAALVGSLAVQHDTVASGEFRTAVAQFAKKMIALSPDPKS